MAGTITVTETFDRGRTYTVRLSETAYDFRDASMTLHKWLWLEESQEVAASVMFAWVMGEVYSDHSVTVRQYVKGEIGHWFEFVYMA